MNALPPILNREFKLPEDGKVHLVPKGNYPVVHDGKRIVQVVDDAALAAIVNDFRAEQAKPDFAGLCIDFDHFRHAEDKPSNAGGWLEADLETRTKGLFGAPRFSTDGEAAVKGGNYRFISPEFDPASLVHIEGNKYRPTRLVGFGLTNNPNMRGMSPLSNRRVGAPDGPPNEADKQTRNMKKVTGLLGLADGADEDSIAGAITTLKENAGKVPVLTNRVTELENERKTLIDESIDADLATAGITDAGTIAKIKPVLLNTPTLKNRQERIDFIALFPKAAAAAGAAREGKPALTNRATAKTPAGGVTDNADDAESAAATRRGNVIANRAREMMAADKRLTQHAAYSRATALVDSETATK